MSPSASKRLIHSLALIAALGLSACNAPASAGRALANDHNTDTEPAPDRFGPSCETDDPNQICLSLKYVVYENSSGSPVFQEQQALTNLATINRIWSQCDIGFEIDEYVTANPSDYGLNFNTSTSAELSSVRNAFVDNSHLLVVTTGTWSGSLGAGSANAWTSMPGSPPYGTVLEQPVGDYPNIFAHELGHQLNLNHVSDTSDVMNAVIYTSSTKLTSSQCNTARAAAAAYWSAMER